MIGFCVIAFIGMVGFGLCAVAPLIAEEGNEATEPSRDREGTVLIIARGCLYE